jgi:hypothetical protein
MIPAARCPSEFRRAERDRVHQLFPGLGAPSTMLRREHGLQVAPIRWTTASGRDYTTEPTRYPI